MADDAAVKAVELALAACFAAGRVGFTMVRTKLAEPGARVAFQAATRSSRKAVLSRSDARLRCCRRRGNFLSRARRSRAAVWGDAAVHDGGIAAQPCPLGFGLAEVVQVKAISRPSAEHAADARELAASFGCGSLPPVVVVEGPSELLAAIEQVVSARSRPERTGERVADEWLAFGESELPSGRRLRAGARWARIAASSSIWSGRRRRRRGGGVA